MMTQKQLSIYSSNPKSPEQPVSAESTLKNLDKTSHQTKNIYTQYMKIINNLFTSQEKEAKA